MQLGEESFPDELQLLRDTTDSLPSSMVAVDARGKILYVNETCRGMIPSLSVGMDLRTALKEMTHVEKVDRLLIQRELVTFRGAPDGPELHWVAWESDDQELVVLTVWETDWSEAMNERRSAFMMAASHELRGPLTTLVGFAEILNMDPSNLTPEQAEAAAIIETTARHLSVLVEDVFDLSRNGFGELRLNLQATDLAQVVDSVVSTLRSRVEERGQTLLCSVENDLPTVMADEARATQMISNLINNASVHNPEGTTIEVAASSAGDRIAVSVRDDGEGLPFEDPAESLISFRRGEQARAGDRTGSGIGLALTRQLIELHRGSIEVESTPGQGSVFTLRFPIDRESALEPGGDRGPGTVY